jgi:hypothetical protein
MAAGSIDPQKMRSEAWSAAYMWADAVVRLADRALDSTDVTTVEHMGDAALITLALRNVLRAAKLAEDFSTDDDRQKISRAIADFENALPDVKNARDVLEHFDDYTKGEGRLQQAEKKAGQQVTYYRAFYERGAGSYALKDLCGLG